MNEVNPLAVGGPDRIVVVDPWPVLEDLAGVSARSIGDIDRVAVDGTEVDQGCAVGRPRRMSGVTTQERPWLAADEREHLIRCPDFRAVA
jgi:hypothetical protein